MKAVNFVTVHLLKQNYIETMLTHIDPILGFIEEVKELTNYPEITNSDTATFRLGVFDHEYHNPIHSGKYDPRLFKAFSNSLRKIIILSPKNEPISLKAIHLTVKKKVNPNQYKELEKIYTSIQDYLNENMNNVTQFSFSFPDTILEKTSVRSLLNDYFASLVQHSKPETQRKIAEINALTFGALTEMIRIMMIDLKKLLEQYSNILTQSLKLN